MLFTIGLVVSEALAAISQVVYPENKGISGLFSALIKVFQSLGAKDPHSS